MKFVIRSSIKGLAKYFAERTPAGGESHELAQVMAKEADRLNRVVSELLELVKPAHLTLQQVDLNEVITHSLHLVSQDAASREIQLPLFGQFYAARYPGRS
jgi:two-component system sensor histidine kinase HydH